MQSVGLRKLFRTSYFRTSIQISLTTTISIHNILFLSIHSFIHIYLTQSPIWRPFIRFRKFLAINGRALK